MLKRTGWRNQNELKGHDRDLKKNLASVGWYICHDERPPPDKTCVSHNHSFSDLLIMYIGKSESAKIIRKIFRNFLKAQKSIILFY